MAYTPGLAPFGEDADAMLRYLVSELQSISAAFTVIDNVQLVKLHAAPSRPREGMVVLADGTNWNPGSGAGFYGYRGGAWQFLG